MSTDLMDQLRKSFGRVTRAKGDWLRVPCPTCKPSDSKKMKRYVSTTGDYTKCWICQPKGMRTSDLLGGNVIMQPFVREAREPDAPHPWAHRMPGHKFIPINELPADHPAVRFFCKDHLTDMDDLYNRFGIVYCPADSGVVITSKPFTTSAERIIFPVNQNHQFIGWQMRSIPGTFYGDRADVIKYIHLFNKGDYLYNYDNAKAFNPNHVIVTEGIKKALKFPNGVATLGKGLSRNQIQLITHWKKITIMLDSEPQTQKEAGDLVEMLRIGGRKALNIDLGKYGYPSPDEATVDALTEIVYREWINYD